MSVSENILLKKLGLSKKFPRQMLYTWRSVLGVGLLKLTIIVFMLSLKLHAGHEKAQDRLSRIIKINEDNASIQNGHRGDVLKAPEKNGRERMT